MASPFQKNWTYNPSVRYLVLVKFIQNIAEISRVRILAMFLVSLARAYVLLWGTIVYTETLTYSSISPIHGHSPVILKLTDWVSDSVSHSWFLEPTPVAPQKLAHLLPFWHCCWKVSWWQCIILHSFLISYLNLILRNSYLIKYYYRLLCN